MQKIKCKCPKCEKLYTRSFEYGYTGPSILRKYCDNCFTKLFRQDYIEIDQPWEDGTTEILLDVAEYGY